MTDYYVDGVDGNDSNAGTSEGSGNAWATIGKAWSTIAAGDTVYIKGNATYDESVSSSLAGTSGNEIHWVGYTTTTGDDGQCTWTSTSSGPCLNYTGTTSRMRFSNIIFDNAVGMGVDFNTATFATFINCKFSNNGDDGITCDDWMSFINCEFINNFGAGIDAASGLRMFVAGCVFYDNASEDYRGDAGEVIIYKCVFYQPAAAQEQLILPSNAAGHYVLGCTFDGDNTASACIEIEGIYAKVVDNILYDSNGYGVEWDASTVPDSSSICAYNLHNSHTTANYESSAQGTIGLKDVSGAPAFTDEAGNDYTLGGTSPAIDAGMQPGNY